MPPRAVLFDFDGVIADTSNIHIVAWQQTLGRTGWLVPDEVAVKAVEVDDRVWLTALFASKKIEDGDIEGWCRLKQALTIELLGQSPVVYPGVIDLIRALQGKVRLAVVTTTWRANVETVLNAMKIADAFEFIIAKEDVQEVKPNPECYRLAVERFGLAPTEVVTIEDSPNGLSAGVDAGISVLAVGHRHPRGEWHRAALEFVPSFRTIGEVEKALGLS